MSYSTTSMPSHIAGGNNVISPTSIPSSQPGGGGGAVPKPHAKAPTTGSSLGKVVNRPKGPIKNPLLNKHKQQQPFGLASPTDKMLSPITRKLAEKRKQNLAGIKPKALASDFLAAKSISKNSSASSKNTTTGVSNITVNTPN